VDNYKDQLQGAPIATPAQQPGIPLAEVVRQDAAKVRPFTVSPTPLPERIVPDNEAPIIRQVAQPNNPNAFTKQNIMGRIREFWAGKP
jgi:hypothetical protein